MDYVVGLLIAALGAIFYFKSKADRAKIDAIVGRTEGREDILKQKQDAYKKQVEEINKNIEKAKDELAKKRAEKLSEEERAKKWDK
jgi:hypothetical protein